MLFHSQVHHAQLFDEGEKNEKARISTLTSDRITDLLPEDIKIKNSNIITIIIIINIVILFSFNDVNRSGIRVLASRRTKRKKFRER